MVQGRLRLVSRQRWAVAHKIAVAKHAVDPTDLPSALPVVLLQVRVSGTPAQGNLATFIDKDNNGYTVNRLETIGWIGGCTDTNELNFLAVKTMRSLGVCYLENQARV